MSWTSISTTLAAQNATTTEIWRNWYEIAGTPNAPVLWAAVSQQHDLPYRPTLNAAHAGAIVRSDNAGATWYRVGKDAGLPSGLPITSVVYGTPKGSSVPVLYAAVWGDTSSSQGGVYRSTNQGSDWSLVQSFPISAYRLVFDNEGTLYLVVSLAGGKIYAMSPTDVAGNGGTFTEMANLNQAQIQAGGPQFFYPVDLTTRNVAPGKIDLYVGTRGVKGGQLAKVYKFDSTTRQWLDMKLPVRADYGLYPNWFGIYFLDDLVYVTSVGHGTWYAPRTEVENVSSLTARWLELGTQGVPFLSTQRITQAPNGDLYITTFGGGVRRLAGNNDHTAVYLPLITK